MITAVIVDDEPMARNTLKTMLDHFCPSVTVVGMAGTCEEAIALIAETRPNIAFLDIQMPDGSGFDVARDCPYKGAKLIFVSAHLDRGVETYQYKALFYLSKPLRITDMQMAIAKYHEMVALEAGKQSLSLDTTEPPNSKESPSPSNMEPTSSKLGWADQLVVPEGTGFRFFAYDEIVYVEGKGNYCQLHLLGEPKPIILSKSIKEIAAMLPTPRFLRVHRSYILHRPFIAKVFRGGRRPIQLRDGTEIPVSREYYADIRQNFFGSMEDMG